MQRLCDWHSRQELHKRTLSSGSEGTMDLVGGSEEAFSAPSEGTSLQPDSRKRSSDEEDERRRDDEDRQGYRGSIFVGGVFDETPSGTNETDQRSTELLGKSTVRSSGSGSFKKRLADIRSLPANKSRQQAGFDSFEGHYPLSSPGVAGPGLLFPWQRLQRLLGPG